MGRITLGGGDFSMRQTGFSNVLDVIKANTRLEAKEAKFTGDVQVLGKLSAKLDAGDIENLENFLNNVDMDALVNDYLNANPVGAGITLTSATFQNDILTLGMSDGSSTSVDLTTTTPPPLGSAVVYPQSGASQPTFQIDSSNNVVQVANLVMTGGFVNYSDRNLKYNIRDTAIGGIDMVSKLTLREYKWKEGGTFVPIGFIAQELEEVNPFFVTEIKGKKAVKTVDLVPVLTKAVQELMEENKRLTKRIENLEIGHI